MSYVPSDVVCDPALLHYYGGQSPSKQWDDRHHLGKLPAYNAMNDRFCKWVRKQRPPGAKEPVMATQLVRDVMRPIHLTHLSQTVGSQPSRMGPISPPPFPPVEAWRSPQAQLQPLARPPNMMESMPPTHRSGVSATGEPQPPTQPRMNVAPLHGGMMAPMGAAASADMPKYLTATDLKRPRVPLKKLSTTEIVTPTSHPQQLPSLQNQQMLPQRFAKAQQQLLELWEQLKVPQSDRHQFSTVAFAEPTVENMRMVNDEIKRLLDRKNATVQVEKNIEVREGFLYLLQELSDRTTAITSDNKDQIKRELTPLIVSLRAASLDVVESIVRWREVIMSPAIYMWKSTSYLLKMQEDLVFLQHSKLAPLIDFPLANNPLLATRGPGERTPNLPAQELLHNKGHRLSQQIDTTPNLDAVHHAEGGLILPGTTRRMKFTHLLQTKQAVDSYLDSGPAPAATQQKAPPPVKPGKRVQDLVSGRDPFNDRIVSAERVLREEAHLMALHRSSKEAKARERAQLTATHAAVLTGKGDQVEIPEEIEQNEPEDGVERVVKVVGGGEVDEDEWLIGTLDQVNSLQTRAAIRIQAVWRGFLDRKIGLQLLRRHRAAIRIQTLARKYLGRVEYFYRLGRFRAARKIQAIIRGTLARMHVGTVKMAHAAATKIQAAWRGTLGRRVAWKLGRRRDAARDIQRVYRGHRVRAHRRLLQKARRNRAATAIQRVFRGFRVRRLPQNNYRKVKGTIAIQAWWRGFLDRRYGRLLGMRKTASVVLQAWWKAIMARRYVAELKKNKAEANFHEFWARATRAALNIQRVYRGYRVRVTYQTQMQAKRMEDASLSIQRLYRGFLARSEVEQMVDEKTQLYALTQLQRVIRGHNGRKQAAVALIRKNGATQIQRIARGRIARNHFPEVQARGLERIAKRKAEEENAFNELEAKRAAYIQAQKADAATETEAGLEDEMEDESAVLPASPAKNQQKTSITPSLTSGPSPILPVKESVVTATPGSVSSIDKTKTSDPVAPIAFSPSPQKVLPSQLSSPPDATSSISEYRQSQSTPLPEDSATTPARSTSSPGATTTPTATSTAYTPLTDHFLPVTPVIAQDDEDDADDEMEIQKAVSSAPPPTDKLCQEPKSPSKEVVAADHHLREERTKLSEAELLALDTTSRTEERDLAALMIQCCFRRFVAVQRVNLRFEQRALQKQREEIELLKQRVQVLEKALNTEDPLLKSVTSDTTSPKPATTSASIPQVAKVAEVKAPVAVPPASDRSSLPSEEKRAATPKESAKGLSLATGIPENGFQCLQLVCDAGDASHSGLHMIHRVSEDLSQQNLSRKLQKGTDRFPILCEMIGDMNAASIVAQYPGLCTLASSFVPSSLTQSPIHGNSPHAPAGGSAALGDGLNQIYQAAAPHIEANTNAFGGLSTLFSVAMGQPSANSSSSASEKLIEPIQPSPFAFVSNAWMGLNAVFEATSTTSSASTGLAALHQTISQVPVGGFAMPAETNTMVSPKSVTSPKGFPASLPSYDDLRAFRPLIEDRASFPALSMLLDSMADSEIVPSSFPPADERFPLPSSGLNLLFQTCNQTEVENEELGGLKMLLQVFDHSVDAVQPLNEEARSPVRGQAMAEEKAVTPRSPPTEEAAASGPSAFGGLDLLFAFSNTTNEPPLQALAMLQRCADGLPSPAAAAAVAASNKYPVLMTMLGDSAGLRGLQLLNSACMIPSANASRSHTPNQSRPSTATAAAARDKFPVLMTVMDATFCTLPGLRMLNAACMLPSANNSRAQTPKQGSRPSTAVRVAAHDKYPVLMTMMDDSALTSLPGLGLLSTACMLPSANASRAQTPNQGSRPSTAVRVAAHDKYPVLMTMMDDSALASLPGLGLLNTACMLPSANPSRAQTPSSAVSRPTALSTKYEHLSILAEAVLQSADKYPNLFQMGVALHIIDPLSNPVIAGVDLRIANKLRLDDERLLRERERAFDDQRQRTARKQARQKEAEQSRHRTVSVIQAAIRAETSKRRTFALYSAKKSKDDAAKAAEEFRKENEAASVIGKAWVEVGLPNLQERKGRAVITIQKLWRRALARMNVKSRRDMRDHLRQQQLAHFETRYLGALAIQCAARSMFARSKRKQLTHLQWVKKVNPSAETIQRAIRSGLARRHAATKNAARKERQQLEKRDAMQVESALRIQLAFKCYKARIELAMRELRAYQKRKQELQVNSAARIQRAWRCHVARREVRKRSEARKARVLDQTKDEAQKLDEAIRQANEQARVRQEEEKARSLTQQQNEAAATIQRGVRCRNARYAADYRRDLRDRKRAEDDGKVPNEAAARIQARVRGAQTRDKISPHFKATPGLLVSPKRATSEASSVVGIAESPERKEPAASFSPFKPTTTTTTSAPDRKDQVQASPTKAFVPTRQYGTEHHEASIVIQCAWRCALARVKVRRKFEEKHAGDAEQVGHDAATRIQRHWRKSIDRRASATNAPRSD